MFYRSSICAVALATALLATPSAAQVVDFEIPRLQGAVDSPRRQPE
jgi:hypothetical protein